MHFNLNYDPFSKRTLFIIISFSTNTRRHYPRAHQNKPTRHQFKKLIPTPQTNTKNKKPHQTIGFAIPYLNTEYFHSGTPQPRLLNTTHARIKGKSKHSKRRLGSVLKRRGWTRFPHATRGEVSTPVSTDTKHKKLSYSST